MNTSQEPRSKTTNLLLIALLVVFLIAAILTAYLTYIAVRDFVLSWELTQLPGIAITSQQSAAGETPGAPPVVQDAQTPLQVLGVPLLSHGMEPAG